MIPFPHYGDFTAFTPVVPELYWNVYSAEERIKALCMEWVKLTAYTDAMADTVNEQYSDLKADIQARYDALDAAVDNIDDIVTQMQAQFPQLVNEQVNAEIRRLITSGEFQNILQAAIDEYWTAYGQRISNVETGLQTANNDIAAERTARIAEDSQIRTDLAADIASVNATLAADVDRLELKDEQLDDRIDAAFAEIEVNNKKLYTKILTPTRFSDTSYKVSDAARAQGFSGDENYFYVASNENDSQNQNIIKVSRRDGTYLIYPLANTTGHGNTITVHDSKLYISQSSTAFDVYDLPTMTYNRRIALQYGYPSIAIRTIANNPYLCGIKSGNIEIELNRITPSGNISNVLANKVTAPPYVYSQGIDFNSDYVVSSWSATANENAEDGTIPYLDVQNYNGDLLARLYIDTDEEIEDVYLDGNRVYYVDGLNGYISYVDIPALRLERSTGFDWLVYASALTNHIVSKPPLDQDCTYDEHNTATRIPIYNTTAMTNTQSRSGGVFVGWGTIMDVPAQVYSRGGGFYMNCIPHHTYLSDVITAVVNYSWNNAGYLEYIDSKVISISNGSVVSETIAEYQTRKNIRRTTDIQSIIRLPDVALTNNLSVKFPV